MNRVRLLLLAAGTRSARNILATLVARRDNVVVVGATSVAGEPGPFECDTVHLVPETASPDFETSLLAILAGERIDLVIPCRDDDVLMLASLRDRRPELASRILSGNGAAAQVVSDKAHAYAFSLEHDLPFVPTLTDASPARRRSFVHEHGFPLIVKPRRGFASIGVFLVWNDRQLEHAFAQPGTVAQTFLGDPAVLSRFREAVEREGMPLFHTFQGRRHSIQVLIAPDGTVADVICIQLQSDRRRSKTVVVDPEPAARDIGERCGAVFSAAGWRGPLNIQCQKDATGRLMIHEYNGRFTGATMTRWHLGFDEVGNTIAAFVGRSIGAAGCTPSSAPVEIFEHMEARGANPADVAVLARDRVWHRGR